MIAEGLKLMIIGMVVVMLFLYLMVVLIDLVSKLTKKAAIEEMAVLEEEKQERIRKANKKKGLQGPPMAVISAAVQAFEQDKK